MCPNPMAYSFLLNRPFNKGLGLFPAKVDYLINAAPSPYKKSKEREAVAKKLRMTDT